MLGTNLPSPIRTTNFAALSQSLNSVFRGRFIKAVLNSNLPFCGHPAFLFLFFFSWIASYSFHLEGPFRLFSVPSMVEETDRVGTFSPTSRYVLARSGSNSQEGIEKNQKPLPTSPSTLSLAELTTSPPSKRQGLRLLPFDALMNPRSCRRSSGASYCRSPEQLVPLRSPREDRTHSDGRHSDGSSVPSTLVSTSEQHPVRRRFQPYPSLSKNDRYDLGRLDFATINSYTRDTRSPRSPHPEYGMKPHSPDFSYFSPHAPIVGHQRVMPPSVLTFRDASLRPYLRRAESAPQSRPATVLRTYSDKVLSTNTSFAKSPLSSCYGAQTPFRSSLPDHDGFNDYSSGSQSKQISLLPGSDSMVWSKHPKQVTASIKMDKSNGKTGRAGRPSNRSRNYGNVCQSCNATTTPEWRKGPTGPRSLCNACGLLYAKMCRKNENDAVLVAQSKHEDTAQARQAAIDELSKPEKQQQFLEALRAGVRAAAHSKNRAQTGSTLEAGTPVSSSAA